MSGQFIDFIRYHVPSETGSLESEDCQFIWDWYEKMAEDTDGDRDLFTGVSQERGIGPPFLAVKCKKTSGLESEKAVTC